MNDLPYIKQNSGPKWFQEAQLAPSLAMGATAELAYRLAERMALVAGMPDGEDAAGRQKLRMMTPDEVTTRSCEIASKMMAEFEARGWLLRLPEPKEMANE